MMSQPDQPKIVILEKNQNRRDYLRAIVSGGEYIPFIFEKENITPETFKVQEIPRISGRGGLRTIITPLNKFQLKGISSPITDEKYQLSLSFILQRGSYATIFLREVIKPANPIKAGF